MKTGGFRAGYRFGLFVCIAVVAVLAFSPLEGVPVTGHDKTNHVLAFVVLAWLADGAYPGSVRVVAKWALALLFYGLFIELVQRFLPYRHFSWLDLGADALGIILYLVASTLLFAAVPTVDLRRQREES